MSETPSQPDDKSTASVTEQSDIIDPQFVLLVDQLKLRRSLLARAVLSWLAECSIEVHAISADALPVGPNGIGRCRLIILSIGKDSVNDPETKRMIEQALSAFENAPIVIICDRDDADEVRAAFCLGASAYIPMSTDPDFTSLIIRFILKGGTFFPPKALLGSGGSHPPLSCGGREQINDLGEESYGSRPRDLNMTSRQRDVLALLQEGLPNKVIARHLGTTEATVKVHVRQIMRRLGVSNRTQVALHVLAATSRSWTHQSHDGPADIVTTPSSRQNLDS